MNLCHKGQVASENAEISGCMQNLHEGSGSPQSENNSKVPEILNAVKLSCRGRFHCNNQLHLPKLADVVDFVPHAAASSVFGVGISSLRSWRTAECSNSENFGSVYSFIDEEVA